LEGAATALQVQERMFVVRRTGAQTPVWHAAALHLGPRILKALEAAGIKQAGYGNSSAPAVGILESALRWLGAKDSKGNAIKRDAIVKAMRKLPRKGNNPA